MEEYTECELSGIFRAKLVTKKYRAWVHGDPIYAYEG